MWLLLDLMKNDREASQDTDLTADDLQELVAQYKGRIEEEMASENYRLDEEAGPLADSEEFLETLPYYIGYLSERTRDLYARVERLDSMAYGMKH